MKVKFLKPVKGYGYFEGDVADIPDKSAKKMLENKQVEVAGKEPKKEEDPK